MEFMSKRWFEARRLMDLRIHPKCEALAVNCWHAEPLQEHLHDRGYEVRMLDTEFLTIRYRAWFQVLGEPDAKMFRQALDDWQDKVLDAR